MSEQRVASAACGPCRSKVDYLKRLPLYQTEKPFQLFIPIEAEAADKRTSNLEFESKECDFEDVRAKAADYTLDDNGFRFLKHPTALDWHSFHDRDAVESRYFAEVKQILQHVEGGYDKILLFDWRVSSLLPQFTPATLPNVV